MTMQRPHNMTFSISGLFCMYNDGDIDLNPYYQRDFVWTKEQEEKLVDSVNHFIPFNAIFLREIANGSKKNPVRYEVVDGKQRLTTLFKHLNSLDNEKDRAKFGKNPVVTYILMDWTDEEIVELYNRLNYGGTAHE